MDFNDASRSFWDFTVGERAGVEVKTDTDLREILAEGVAGDLLWPGSAVSLQNTVSVTTHGAKGDGVTDDTVAIQAAVNAASVFGANVSFPPGNFLSGKINVATSDLRISGSVDTIITLKAGTDIWLNVTGTKSDEVPIAVAVSSGDTAISTTTAHGLAVGDLTRILSQRDAVGADADAQWRLGFNTPTATTCYFGEFMRVASVGSGTAFVVDSGLLFPTYRPDKTLEVNTTATTARDSTTISKISAAKNITIENFVINGVATNSAILVKYGYNVKIKNVQYYPTANSYFVVFESCFSCRAEGCQVTWSDNQDDPAQHHLRNAYKTHGCQDTGFFNCFGERATQTFDLTYGGDTPRMCSVNCYIDSCETKGSSSNGATTHGGTYGSQIVNNRFLENRKNGVSNRSRNATIVGNTITGSRGAATYGLNLYEGWARNCSILGNIISGFETGFQVADGVEDGEAFQWVGLTFAHNVITQFGLYGISVTRNGNNKYVGETGLNFKDNIIVGCYGAAGSPKGIIIRGYVCGAFIEDNTIDGSSLITAGIHIIANSSGHRIANNLIMNSSSRGIWFEATSDAVVWPSGTTHDLGNGNRIVNATSGRYFIGASVLFNTKFGQGGTGGAGTTAVTVTGSRGGNVALASLITILVNMGLVIDGTTA